MVSDIRNIQIWLYYNIAHGQPIHFVCHITYFMANGGQLFPVYLYEFSPSTPFNSSEKVCARALISHQMPYNCNESYYLRPNVLSMPVRAVGCVLRQQTVIQIARKVMNACHMTCNCHMALSLACSICPLNDNKYSRNTSVK